MRLLRIAAARVFRFVGTVGAGAVSPFALCAESGEALMTEAGDIIEIEH